MDNLLTALDHQGQTRTFTLDDFGEPVTASYADGRSTSFTWNVMGTEWKVVDSVGGTIERSYDGLDRLYGEQTAQGTVNWNNFDALNRAGNEYVTGVDGVSQLYQYAWDNANRLVEIKGPSGTVKFSYDAANRRTVAQLPNGIRGCYYYDAANELLNLSYMPTGTTVCPSTAPSSGYLGNLTYTYDAAGRVASRGGTLFQSVLPTPVTSATYDGDNRLNTWTTPTSGVTLNYNGDEDVTCDNYNAAGGTCAGRYFSWDSRNRMTAFTGGYRFVYDGQDRRIHATIGANYLSYLYDGANVAQEQVGSTVTANILNGPGPDERYSRTTSADTFSYLTDGLGSVVALTNSSGAITTSYAYDPYGNTSASGTASDNPDQFTGRENDGDGYYYYRARYYNPTWGRFMSQDPIGFRGGDTNLFRYVQGNSLSYIDPTGQIPWGWFD